MFFRGFQRFGVFFEQGFHSDCIPPKRGCSPMSTGVSFLAERKQITSSQSTCIRDDFVRDRSFLEVLILERAWPVW